MKKFNKGMVITSTVAAALAALTFAGCGSTAGEIAHKNAPSTANAAQAVKNEEAAKPAAAAASATETAEEKTSEKKTEKKAETAAAKKDSKKKSDKKKKSTKKNTKKTTEKASEKTAEKAAEKPAETAKKNTQPAAVVPTVQVQPAQTQKTAETPASTQAPAVKVPDEVYPVWVEGDVYAGTYAEEIAGRGCMEITRNSDGTYSVQVDWSSSAFEKSSWNFSGEFNGRGVMHYTNCRKTTVAFDEYGNYACDSYGYMTPYTTYTMGSGYIEFKDEGVLEWHDDMGDIIPGTTFVSCKKSYNTKAPVISKAPVNSKAHEVGTAGSCYYENEYGHKKADEIGTAGSNYYNFNYGWEAEGTFYEVNGSRMRLEITKSNMGDGLYNCSVICSGSAFDCEIYSFLARYENDTLVYDCGARSYTSYDSNGCVVENYIIDEGHFGTISYTGAAGLRWTDSDGSSYVFMSDITLA